MIKAGVSACFQMQSLTALVSAVLLCWRTGRRHCGRRRFMGPVADAHLLPEQEHRRRTVLLFAQHGVELDGVLNNAEVGETMIFPPILTLQYHFDSFNGIKPYVGAGVQFIHFFDESAELAGYSDFEIDSAFGFSLQGGVDVELGGGWYAGADVRYTWLETEATLTHATNPAANLRTDFDLDPLIVSAHVGYRFNLFNRAPVMESLK